MPVSLAHIRNLLAPTLYEWEGGDMAMQAFDYGALPPSYEERAKQRAEAHEKAEALLKENLTPAQLASYDTHCYFTVKGGKTGKTYRIEKPALSLGPNVAVIGPLGGVSRRLCFGPRDRVPQGDQLLIQKVALETDEQHVLDVANDWF